jgi:hypothetical protein
MVCRGKRLTVGREEGRPATVCIVHRDEQKERIILVGIVSPEGAQKEPRRSPEGAQKEPRRRAFLAVPRTAVPRTAVSLRRKVDDGWTTLLIKHDFTDRI